MSKNVVLTGMMGWEVHYWKNLAYKLSFNFFDIDKLIEKKEGSSINMIFKNRGEKHFKK